MSRLDLPNRCLKPIQPEHPEADDSQYYTVCARPEGHAHGCMSAAVWERKEEARKAKEAAKGGADSGKQTLITHVADSLERLDGEHGFQMVTALWIYPEVQRAAQAYEQSGETEAFDKVVGKFLKHVEDHANNHGFRIIGHVNLSHPSGFEVGDEVFHPEYGEGHVVSLNDDGGVRVRWHGVGGTANE